MSKRNRNKRPARPSEPDRKQKPIILVVCEGVTEIEYLSGFVKDCLNPRVRIELYKIGTPKTIVEWAIEKRAAVDQMAGRYDDDNLKYDDVWCVYDMDDHPLVTDAWQQARDNQLKVAFSNPCFELWLLLHFREQPGCQHRDDLRPLLKEFVPNYDKHVEFEMYAKGYNSAVKRAEHLDEEAELDREPGRNPTTGVWKLTSSIRENS